MAFFTIQRNGYKSVVELVQQVIEDMVDNGFRVVHPIDYVPSSRVPTTQTELTVILEAGPDVDPLSTSQPWRVAFRMPNRECTEMIVATPMQLQDDGDILILPDSTGKSVGTAGCVGKMFDKDSSVLDASTGFINRAKRINYFAFNPGGQPPQAPENTKVSRGDGSTYPLNYRLTIAPHGFFLGAYEGNWASLIDGKIITTANLFNWVVVQRPVNKDTGAPLITGKCPVFCVNGVNAQYWKFVVREADIPHPTLPVRADAFSEDNFKIINILNQNSITEDKKYIISFIHNLNTPRFRYQEELDLVATTSADIIMEGIQVDLNVFGSTRKYVALPGSADWNTGLKILTLAQM